MKEFTYLLNGKAINQQRTKKGYTQEQLSELCNISKSQIQRMESDHSVTYYVDTYLHLMEVLDPDLNLKPFYKYLRPIQNLS